MELLGREDELAGIIEFLHFKKSGNLVIHGVKGLGKSHLLDKVQEQLPSSTHKTLKVSINLMMD